MVMGSRSHRLFARPALVRLHPSHAWVYPPPPCSPPEVCPAPFCTESWRRSRPLLTSRATRRHNPCRNHAKTTTARVLGTLTTALTEYQHPPLPTTAGSPVAGTTAASLSSPTHPECSSSWPP